MALHLSHHNLQLLLLWLTMSLSLMSQPFSAQRHRIVNLPGQPTMGPRFGQYSGYLQAAEQSNSRLFYWLVESSEKPPEEAPLVLWLNGGPGCSSIGGLLTTNGPFLVNDRAQLVHNPWAWNRVANMLYLESPAGVGFSYGKARTSSKFRWNDGSTTRDNILALRQFLLLFPEYRARNFYLTGESYAGVYLPLLAEALLADERLSRPDGLRLRGVAIGNGYFMARAEFAYFMGLMPVTEKQFKDPDPTFNEYNVESLCHHNILGYNDSYRCLNTTAMEHYLQRPDVRRALGVSPQAKRYHICSGRIFTSYDFRNEALTHQLLLLNRSKIDVLLYNGNLDYLLPYLATAGFVDNMTWPLQGNRYSWYYCQCMFGAASVQVGGSETSLNAFTIRYRSVSGAGHSTPIEKPEASFQLFVDFLMPSLGLQPQLMEQQQQKRVLRACEAMACQANGSGAVALASKFVMSASAGQLSIMLAAVQL
uniref:Carboxypeptidase n=1 Tax=Macrostomum lignano TaxID=282301 RepID=A0A1I8G221_9PLAT